VSCINLYYKQVPSAQDLSAKHIYNISGIHQKGVCVCVCGPIAEICSSEIDFVE
jgi:hypothetical protein